MNNCLAVIAHKCASNVFDLSSRLTEYSIRDQIVRAALFADQLAAAKLVTPGGTILIVGAGVTGVTAATKLAAHGYKVIVLEVNRLPFCPMRFCTTRYVGPYMYEWPASCHRSQAFPMGVPATPDASCPSWDFPDPIPVNRFIAAHLDPWLKTYVKHSPRAKNLSIYVSVNGADVEAYVKHFVAQKDLWSVQPLAFLGQRLNGDLTAEPESAIPSERPRCVVLAAGVGQEKLEIGASGRTTPFWVNDNLKNPGTAAQKIGVLGGGDGALQDFLRAALDFNHPLEAVQSDPVFEPLLRQTYLELLSAEVANKRLSSWGFLDAGSRHSAAACADAARQLVDRHGPACRDFLARILRPGSGSVTLIRENADEKRCYLLNRFLVTLLATAYERDDHLGKVHLQFVTHHGRVTAEQVTAGAGGIHVALDKHPHTFDQVVVRFGLGGSESRGEQWVSLAANPEPARINFVHLALPFSPA